MSELHLKIGKLLRLERKRRSMTLEELSTRLKISTDHLQHIEDGRPQELPAELYFDLFAKSYAEALEIDYVATVEAIKEDIGQPLESASKRDAEPPAVESEAPEDQPARETTPGSRFPRSYVILVAVVAAAFLAFLAINQLFFADSEPGTTPDEAVAADPTSTGRSNPASPDSIYADYDWNVPPYRVPQEMKLTLLAREVSWATVLADGDTAICRTLVPGKLYTVAADYRYRVSIAWPTRVDVELNDIPVDLRNPATRRISRVVVNQRNIDSILNAPEVTRDPATGGGSQPALIETPVATTSPMEGDTAGNDSLIHDIGENDSHER